MNPAGSAGGPFGAVGMSAALAPKGATGRDDKSGPAVQNMNIMLGFPETTSLV